MIRLEANKVSLTVRSTEVLTSGSVGIYQAQFSFSSDWDGLDKTAVFRAKDVTISVPLSADNTCQVPWEVLVSPAAALQVGVYGTQNGDLVMPTMWVSLGNINKGTSMWEQEKPPPTDLYAQILSTANQAVEVANSVRQAADDGAFDGPQGPQGVQGEPGPQGIQGIPGPQGQKGDKGDTGNTGAQGPRGDTGPQGQIGDKGDTGERGPRGYSGLVPAVSVPWAAEITVQANTKTTIGTTEGATAITLGPAVEGYDNEWPFIVAQGETAYDIILPVIEWHGGYAPVFGANSRTEVRLWYDGDILKGVWL